MKEYGEASLQRLRESEGQRPVRMSGAGDYPDGAPGLISAAIYGFRGLDDGGRVSLSDFEGRAQAWNRVLGLEGEDLDASVRGVLEKIRAARKGDKE